MDIGQRLMQALACAVNAQACVWEERLSEEEWEQLLNISQLHRVQPLVFEAVAASPAFRAASAQLRSRIKRTTLINVALQAKKTAAFFDIIGKINSAGVQPVVVKGLSCRRLYPMPDHRPSGDEDIWLSGDEAECCARVLEENGFSLKADGDSFVKSYVSAESGLVIELHTRLFGTEEPFAGMQRCLDGALQRAVVREVRGVEYRELEPTDGFAYLVLHALKHFVFSGFGVRQICDIVLYARENCRDVDWARLEGLLSGLRAVDFTAALFDIGERSLGVRVERPVWLCGEPGNGDALLKDALSAGIYGKSSASRLHSSHITLGAVSGRRDGGIVSGLFPSAERLKPRYPVLERYPMLLPAVWAARLFEYGKKHLRMGDTSLPVSVGRERAELLRRYNITD